MHAAEGRASEAGETRAVAGSGGLRLAVSEHGRAEAPPVVLLHGGGQTRHAWGGTAAELAAAGWRAWSLDLRGHGESNWAPDGDYRLDRFVEDLVAVVASLPAPPVVVGASLGGLTALCAVGEGHVSARALVLVDIAPRIERDGAERILQFMRGHPDGFPSLEAAADAVASYLPHRRRPDDLSGLERNLRRGDDGRWRWHWDPELMSGERRLAPQSDPERLDRAARALRLPTLLVRGRLSDLLSEEGARHFLELAPHARFADVSEAGHMVAGDRNDAFTRAVVGFLADV